MSCRLDERELRRVVIGRFEHDAATFFFVVLLLRGFFFVLTPKNIHSFMF